PSAASSAWVEAVRLSQFEGAEKEGAQFRAWKDNDGAAFTDVAVQRAVQLYFRWLALTMQRSLGTPAKDLLPQVIQHTKDVAADQTTMDAFADKIQKDKDMAQSRLHGNRKDTSREDERTRKVHDQVLRTAINAGPPVRVMRAEDLVKVDQWEMVPGNIEGIFNAIVLPELRAVRDPRVFEYWDMKIAREGEAVKTKPAFDQDKFKTERYPQLLWSRAKEYVALGQPNRALAEMFKVAKNYPQHPSLGSWIQEIETLLAPKAPTPTATPATEASAGTSAPTQ
ncbi:MAG TPA: hypothetical protein VFG14_05525, partial [Chthoniobacteraceae bacterium]|nr:hypothetical protein [Chthoniobacteraceae bacterium]